MSAPVEKGLSKSENNETCMQHDRKQWQKVGNIDARGIDYIFTASDTSWNGHFSCVNCLCSSWRGSGPDAVDVPTQSTIPCFCPHTGVWFKPGELSHGRHAAKISDLLT